MPEHHHGGDHFDRSADGDGNAGADVHAVELPDANRAGRLIFIAICFDGRYVKGRGKIFQLLAEQHPGLGSGWRSRGWWVVDFEDVGEEVTPCTSRSTARDG